MDLFKSTCPGNLISLLWLTDIHNFVSTCTVRIISDFYVMHVMDMLASWQNGPWSLSGRLGGMALRSFLISGFLILLAVLHFVLTHPWATWNNGERFSPRLSTVRAGTPTWAPASSLKRRRNPGTTPRLTALTRVAILHLSIAGKDVGCRALWSCWEVLEPESVLNPPLVVS